MIDLEERRSAIKEYLGDDSISYWLYWIIIVHLALSEIEGWEARGEVPPKEIFQIYYSFIGGLIAFLRGERHSGEQLTQAHDGLKGMTLNDVREMMAGMETRMTALGYKFEEKED